MVLFLAGALFSIVFSNTVVHPDCKARNFEPKACKISEVMNKGGK